MIYNSTIPLPEKAIGEKYVFLAGSMDADQTTNWRTQCITALENSHHIFDPTHKEHDSLNKWEMKNHINWELDALNRADIIILNFLPNALSPISLVELGLYVPSGKLIVICPKEFYKNTYVTTLCKKYNTPIFLSTEQALNTIQ